MGYYSNINTKSHRSNVKKSSSSCCCCKTRNNEADSSLNAGTTNSNTTTTITSYEDAFLTSSASATASRTSDEKLYRMCCGMFCIKSLAVIFNFILIGSGVLLACLAFYVLHDKSKLLLDLTDSHSNMLYLLVATYGLAAAGAMAVLAGLIGIVGAWFELRRLLVFYIVFLMLIFAIEITAGVFAFLFRVQLKDRLIKDYQLIVHEKYGQSGHAATTHHFDNLQQRFKCCGAANFLDWKHSKYVLAAAGGHQNQTVVRKSKSNGKHNLVAESCCITPSQLCAVRDHPSNIYYRGCAMALDSFITNDLMMAGMLGCGICLFQAVGVFIVAVLIRRIKQKFKYEQVSSSFIENSY